MGSTSPAPVSFPDASSLDLILTEPTAEERNRVWSGTHPMWGPALSHDDYLLREAYLTTVPLAKDGGITHWILTDRASPPGQRPILSSCETLRKRALCCRPSGAENAETRVVEGVAHGIGSVFTDPQFRGRGYASRMMREVGARLREWQVSSGPRLSPTLAGADNDAGEGGLTSHSLFSVLYSDIGKQFYSRHGWAPFESSHVAFPPVPGASSGLEPQNGYARVGGEATGRPTAKPIGYHEMAELCNVDEQLLKAVMVKRAKSATRTCVALLPDLDALLWHLMREDFMTKHIFGRTPSVKGAVYGDAGSRLWAVWTRGYYGGLDKVEGNTFHILRFVAEDEGCSPDYLIHGFRSIIEIAQAEAAEWRSQDIQMWNPSPTIKKLVEGCGLDYEYVDRDKESIASLMWYGDEPTEELDWVANEKYAWC